MSLCSLKKSRPTVKTIAHVSVEDFIDDALAYANGLVAVPASSNVTPIRSIKDNAPTQKPMKRRTFTLSEQCIDNLDALSQRTGIAKSRLVRILVNNAAIVKSCEYLTDSDTK
jgi:hypothetical protein